MSNSRTSEAPPVEYPCDQCDYKVTFKGSLCNHMKAKPTSSAMMDCVRAGCFVVIRSKKMKRLLKGNFFEKCAPHCSHNPGLLKPYLKPKGSCLKRSVMLSHHSCKGKVVRCA